uniref:Uncharacterized protein n=1 Tax=Arundo donax TaxID=35708 RepID=A0A0A9B5P4_ARUDO
MQDVGPLWNLRMFSLQWKHLIWFLGIRFCQVVLNMGMEER